MEDIPFTIGIAGGTGSGKTTVAHAIVDAAGCDRVTFLSFDNYYRDLTHLPVSERAKMNFDHPDSLEIPLLVEHLTALRAGRTVNEPTYDFAHHTRLPGTVEAKSAPVIVVEGILTLSLPELRGLLDLKIFVDTEADIRFIRRLQRDVSERGRTMESVIQKYLGDVRPMHMEFVEPSKRYADIIIPEGGRNSVALDLLITKVRERLA